MHVCVFHCGSANQERQSAVWIGFNVHLHLLVELTGVLLVVFPSSTELDAVNREACERFAAGYIQCMHDVHTFVSSCPGIDPTEAAELLNHLLECMPLNDEDRPWAISPDSSSTWSLSESMHTALVSPAPSTTSSSDDLCSDLDETDSEQSHISSSEESDGQDVLSLPSLTYPKSVWRPW